jgi:two-component system, NarL family, response regulator NreC
VDNGVKNNPEEKKMDIRIIIADDHKIVVDGLRTLLANQPGVQVVAQASNGRITVDLAKKLIPDIIIMDINMPDLNGIEATRQILAILPQTRIIALSMYSDTRMVGEMLKAGASGYLLKDCAFEELTKAVEMVMTSQTYLSPGITDIVIGDYVRHLTNTPSTVFSILTDREREVLQLLAEGKTTKQIATDLRISVKTVETHRQQIMERLNIHSVAELTKYAIREGITSLEK